MRRAAEEAARAADPLPLSTTPRPSTRPRLRPLFQVATEDVVYMLHGMGVETGLDLEKLVLAGRDVTEFLGIETRSKAGAALWRKMVREGRAE